jgi:hypothetical protein
MSGPKNLEYLFQMRAFSEYVYLRCNSAATLLGYLLCLVWLGIDPEYMRQETLALNRPVFRIRHISIWYASGSSDPYSGLRIRIMLF